MEVKLTFKNPRTKKERNVKIETTKSCLYELLTDTKELISIITENKRENEFFKGIKDID